MASSGVIAFAQLPAAAPPTLGHLSKRALVDLQEHRIDHVTLASQATSSNAGAGSRAALAALAVCTAAAASSSHQRKRRGHKGNSRCTRFALPDADNEKAVEREMPGVGTAVLERTKTERIAEDGKMSLEKENEKLLEDLALVVQDINELEDYFDQFSDEELRVKTQELKAKIQAAGDITDEMIVEGFALLREAVWRVLELWYFDVQLLGGLILFQGRLAEMKTGEGKTIVALLPTFLAALEGKGACFIIAPNDYLSRRDCENVGQVLKFLGLTVGLLQATMETVDRQKAYKCDVVYGTNAEIGFDYLRDNLAVYPSQVTQCKGFHYCLVDEADSILVDEARTPLIISESVPAESTQFEVGREVANVLQNELHYNVDEKNKNLQLTDLGEKAAEDVLSVETLWDPEFAWIIYVLNALKAKELFKKGEQYIIREGKLAIVDTFTGRVLEGRRWADGMHQAIECKEGIEVGVRTRVTASITYQSLFRLFPRLCGMTGTAMTEVKEFEEIYNLRGTAIPTALPNVRRDYPDVVYKTEEAKISAIVEEIVLQQEKNLRPILIGTSSVNMSEEIVTRLRDQGIKCLLLNARPESVSRESEVIAQAGRLGKVTVATNMAGRGTDIILGGNGTQMAQLKLRQILCDSLPNIPLEEQAKVPAIDDAFWPREIPEELQEGLDEALEIIGLCQRGIECKTFLQLEELVAEVAGDAPFDDKENEDAMGLCREAYRELRALYKESLFKERDAVIKAGGLYVLGTCRHESRRIDNQLRGRAGRQGDPGTTRIFVSLQDEIFRVFGGEKIEDLMTKFRLGDDTPLQSKIVTDTLDRVQTAVEEYFKMVRNRLFDFDKVISKQRELTYATRAQYLKQNRDVVTDLVYKWGRESVDEWLLMNEKKTPEERKEEYEAYYGHEMSVPVGEEAEHIEEMKERVVKAIDTKWEEYEDHKAGFALEAAQIATVVTIDDEWKEMLRKMDALKQTVGLAQYKGSDPLKEYQIEGFKMFRKFENKFKARSVSRWLRSKPKSEEELARIAKEEKEKEAKKLAAEKIDMSDVEVQEEMRRQAQEKKEFVYGKNYNEEDDISKRVKEQLGETEADEPEDEVDEQQQDKEKAIA